MTEFTLEQVSQAIAAAVSTALPGVTVYDNPNQQHTSLPALFITMRGEQAMEPQLGQRWLRKLRYDLCYLEQYNLPDLGDRYQVAAEALDDALEVIPFGDGLPLRTTKRNWFVEPGALHYQFDLTVRLSRAHRPAPMGNMAIREGLK